MMSGVELPCKLEENGKSDRSDLIDQTIMI
jgi:hypothetical protein